MEFAVEAQGFIGRVEGSVGQKMNENSEKQPMLMKQHQHKTSYDIRQ
jgi:hypothetical protein